MTLDFSKIVPRNGGQRDAFEELCCQIARRSRPANSSFVRLRGGGGDGGVECFADLTNGTQVGWQAKFVTTVEALLKQVSKSLSTTLAVHPTLTRYIVCFPFDLTGPTKRRGKSELEKLQVWKKQQEDAALQDGRVLDIEPWPASELLRQLLDVDRSGGIREYFFNDKILSHEWFERHIARAMKTAGPRYSRQLSVETDLWLWCEALGDAPTWTHSLTKHVKACEKHCLESLKATERPDSAASHRTPWPSEIRDHSHSLFNRLSLALSTCKDLVAARKTNGADQAVSDLEGYFLELEALEETLVTDLESRHGKNVANSVSFRQFMAEYQCEFPASNLDQVREVIKAVSDLRDWLCSPEARIGFERSCVVSGIAGSGKTHGICDAAIRRLEQRRLSCVVFGHEFASDPDLWTRLRESLEFSPVVGMDALLDALNAAAEATGEPLILFLDAINETRPLSYWRERLSTLVHGIESREFLRLCVTCRSSFIPYSVPIDSNYVTAEHRGFQGIEHRACEAFLQHFGLEPLVSPIIQPELANPLYLKLICSTARAQKLNRLPAGGWHFIRQ